LPVVKEKGAAHRDVATHTPKASLAPVTLSIDLISLLVLLILFILHLARNKLLPASFVTTCYLSSRSAWRLPDFVPVPNPVLEWMGYQTKAVNITNPLFCFQAC